MRLLGAVVALPFVEPVAALLAAWSPDASRLAVDAHFAFNFALVIVFLPIVGLMGGWLDQLLPTPAATEQGPRYLDEASLEAPVIALSCAARETLRIGDRVDAMLQTMMMALQTGDEKLCTEISRMDDEIDRLQEAVKLYLARLGREGLDDAEGQRATEIISFAINLEHIGDIIDKSLRELIAKKLKHKLTFSAEGFSEIETLHVRTRENLHLAQSIFVSRDVKLARRLIQEKVNVREIEQRSADQHLERLRQGRIESLQTSALHLDIMRDLKRINAHISSVAYPVLSKTGELHDSRLKEGVASTDHLTVGPTR
jgi:phosphate:Na+ symporter